jgi:hypothetical protein
VDDSGWIGLGLCRDGKGAGIQARGEGRQAKMKVG